MRRINEELVVVFAEDTEKAIAYFLVDAAATRCWLESDALYQSLTNFARRAPPVKVADLADGIFMVAAGGNYEATLVLMPHFLRRVAPAIDGDIVVGIPNRDMLLLTGSRNAKGIATLRSKVTHSFRTGDRALSDQLFVLRDGHIFVFRE